MIIPLKCEGILQVHEHNIDNIFLLPNNQLVTTCNQGFIHMYTIILPDGRFVTNCYTELIVWK